MRGTTQGEHGSIDVAVFSCMCTDFGLNVITMCSCIPAYRNQSTGCIARQSNPYQVALQSVDEIIEFNFQHHARYGFPPIADWFITIGTYRASIGDRSWSGCQNMGACLVLYARKDMFVDGIYKMPTTNLKGAAILTFKNYQSEPYHGTLTVNAIGSNS